MIETMVGRLVSPVLIGRSAEIATAGLALDAAEAGQPINLLIGGEAGVGKSRLVDQLSRLAADRGFHVLRGACANVGDGGMPYEPIVEALRGLARDLDADTLAVVVGTSGPDLARLLPTLASDAPVEATVRQEWLQTRLFEGLVGLFQRLAAKDPVVLVLEDLHWADASTRDAVAFLVRNLRTARVLLVTTFRSDELHRRHPLLHWLAEAERDGAVERIDLRRLDAAETRDLVAAIRGSEPTDELVARIQGRSDGNPFFVEELLHAEEEATGGERLPPTLRDVLQARLARVPEATQAILGVAAVAGRRVDHDLLAAIAALPESTLDEALRAAVTTKLLVIETQTGGEEGYAFRHALLQEVAYDDLLPGERKRLHRACATVIAARRTGDGAAAAAHWAELARHWAAARDDRATLDASVKAAEAAERTFAFLPALRHWERALATWSDVPDATSVAGMDRVDVLARASTAAFLSGDERRDVALRREAIAEVDPLADSVRSALLHQQLGRSLWGIGDTDGALVAYEDALRLVPVEPPTAARARVLAGYGQMLMLLDRWAESLATCEQAIAMARQVGADEVEGHALNSLGMDLGALGRTNEAAHALEEALRIAVLAGNADDVGRAYANQADSYFFSGDVARAADVVEEGIVAAERFGVATSWGALIRHTGILIFYDLGRWQAAADLAIDQSPVSTIAAADDRYKLARQVNLLVSTGAAEAPSVLERLGGLIRQGPVESQFTAPYYGALVEHLLWDGRAAEGLAAIERALAEMANKDTWYWHLMRLHRVGARAAADLAEMGRARRDREIEQDAIRRAAVLRDARDKLLAATLKVQTGTAGDESLAEASTAMAEDSRLVGSLDPDPWREVLARWRDRDRPYLVAYVLWREAEASLAVGDRAAAVQSLSEASSISARLGARPLLEAITSLADRTRIRLVAAHAGDNADPPEHMPEPAPPPTDPFGLTERELDVLALVSLGRTNRQIGEELFISGNTAGVHVSNILAKLGASSRTEAASIAIRLGLTTDR
jgi:DNA-binding CsgD family transcriptional regulator/tetratricopeptide (TPR) repeat protein